jgi:hypothetical protein
MEFLDINLTKDSSCGSMLFTVLPLVGLKEKSSLVLSLQKICETRKFKFIPENAFCRKEKRG